MKNIKLIAEIGCNHKGDLKLAKEMIIVAATFCNVDVVKFQKRRPKELLSENQYKSPHPNPINAFGETYGKHREYLEFTAEEHSQLKNWCEEYGVIYSTSVWETGSARDIMPLKPQLLKIPSASNTNTKMLEMLCEDYQGEIHLSLGMTTREEEESIIKLFVDKGRANDLVIYSCTSGYPVPFEDICLLEIHRLKETYGTVVKEIGFSGHHLGIAADIAAIALGATWVERHFTLDRTWKGTDHAASLEPQGIRKLSRDLENVDKALKYKSNEVLEIEEVQRIKLKWSNI